MKKIFTFLVMSLFLMTTAKAADVKLASFENLEEDLMYFEPYKDLAVDRFETDLTPDIRLNGDKSGLNTTEKSLTCVNVADADWWGNFAQLTLKTPIKITESNRYLKFLVHRSIQPKNFRIGFNGREDADQIFGGKVTTDGQWCAVVVDMGTKFIDQTLEYFVIINSNNWDEPRNGWGPATYMYDEFYLSDNMIPAGAEVATDLFNLGFESEETSIKTLDKQDDGNILEIVDNPKKEINTTDKVIKFETQDNKTWWQAGPRIVFNKIYDVTGPNKFLHVFVYVPKFEENILSVNFQLNAKSPSGVGVSEDEEVWDEEVGGSNWTDLVLNVAKITYVSEISVRYDVKYVDADNLPSTAGTFYVDGIMLSSDPAPRESLEPSSVPQITLVSDYVQYSNNTIQIVNDNCVAVELMDATGKTIAKSTEKTIQITAKGLIIAKITDKEGKQFVQKVLCY